MSRSKLFLFSLLAIVLVSFLTACAETSSANITYIVGDGTGTNHDRLVHKIILPGQIVPTTLDHEVARYVPGNARNFIINNGTVTNANGEKVGDRGTLTLGTTKSGKAVSIASRSLFMLNQNEAPLREFFSLCFKFTCWSEKDAGGTANSSEPGWNRLLAEVFAPSVDAAARVAMSNMDDDIWKTHDQNLYKALGEAMSKAFADQVRPNTGSSRNDLFCGSSNSSWPDPAKPGVGEFNCSPVFFAIDDVQPLVNQADQGASVTTLNEQRCQNAKAVYGPNGCEWLAIMDAIEKCGQQKVSCIVTIGSGGPVSVPVPVPDSLVPTPTPVKK